jgi:hypothetical protein
MSVPRNDANFGIGTAGLLPIDIRVMASTSSFEGRI